MIFTRHKLKENKAYLINILLIKLGYADSNRMNLLSSNIISMFVGILDN
jgi:hypothetical protein